MRFHRIMLPLVLFCTGCESTRYTAGQAVRLMNNPASADARREGLAALAVGYPFSHVPPYTTQFKQMAQNDPDPLVRAMAIRALNISRDASATKLFVAALGDENPNIRIEAAKALANIPDNEAVVPLTRLLEGTRFFADSERAGAGTEPLDVRLAAADALRRYHSLDVARTLVGYLDNPNFSIAWQSHQSLVELTHTDLKYSERDWLDYLVGPGKPFG